MNADGHSFLRIVDGRSGSPRSYVLRGVERQIYLRCMDITSRAALVAEFGATAGEAAVAEILERLTAQLLMFTENDKYLSLAPAPYPDVAARRIRAARAAP